MMWSRKIKSYHEKCLFEHIKSLEEMHPCPLIYHLSWYTNFTYVSLDLCFAPLVCALWMCTDAKLVRILTIITFWICFLKILFKILFKEYLAEYPMIQICPTISDDFWSEPWDEYHICGLFTKNCVKNLPHDHNGNRIYWLARFYQISMDVIKHHSMCPMIFMPTNRKDKK